jgi:LmbE family N-acetylglucosaminyl deacetylase
MSAESDPMSAEHVRRTIYLSPHLDDAVLSCGGQIAAATRSGDTVEIVTLFAGDEPGPSKPPASPLVTKIYDLWKLRPGEVMATRRREDLAAAGELATGIDHWELQEAIHRRDPRTGDALYPTLERLFGPIAPTEEPLVARLAERLGERFAGAAGGSRAARIVAPLGVGGHVDHRIVRAAAERAFGAALLYYEEFPYIVWKFWALRRAGISGRSWEAIAQRLAPEDVAARVAAIACYASQVTPLFRSPERIERLVRRHVRRARGERLWRRRDDHPAASFEKAPA